MKRRHLFEFSDQRWLPRRLRHYLTDLLQCQMDWDGTYDVVLPMLNRVLAHRPQGPVIDLCSGSSGPWKRWMADKKLQGRSVILTDKYPEVPEGGGGTLPPWLIAYPGPVDALRIPPSLKGDLTLFTCFHHFPPRDAVTILEQAVAQGRAVCLFEFTRRRFSTLAGMLFSPLVVLVLTLRIRPVSLDRLFWTLCVPVVPLVYLWDGMVSHLRTYSVAELSALHGAFDNDYTWECGILPVPETGQVVSYLAGYKLTL